MITRAGSLSFLVLPALVVLLAAACSQSAPPASSGPPAASGPSAVSRPSTGLAGLLVTDVPAGFAVRPEAGSHTGPADLAKAARDDGRPGARAALTAARFRRGYQRLWTNTAGDVVAVQVYAFAGTRGATAWVHRVDAQAQAQATHVVPYAVPGLPTAAGSEVDVEGDTTDQVSAVRGAYVLQVVCSAHTETGLRARAQQLALAQYRRLAGS